MKRASTAKMQSRSHDSRKAVLDAVVELISREGFSACSTANIAERAGSSWGVLQYQFGTKRDIFEAVLLLGVTELDAALKQLLHEHRDDSDLLRKFLDIIWQYYSSPLYRASMEILFNHSHDEDGFRKFALYARATLTQSFRTVFKRMKVKVAPSKAKAIIDITLASLRGLAIGTAIAFGTNAAQKAQRAMLAQMVRDALEISA